MRGGTIRTEHPSARRTASTFAQLHCGLANLQLRQKPDPYTRRARELILTEALGPAGGTDDPADVVRRHGMLRWAGVMPVCTPRPHPTKVCVYFTITARPDESGLRGPNPLSRSL